MDFESPALQLGVSGSGDVEGSWISVGVLDAGVSGSGEMRYRGSPARVDVRTTGSGRVINDGWRFGQILRSRMTGGETVLLTALCMIRL